MQIVCTKLLWSQVISCTTVRIEIMLVQSFPSRTPSLMRFSLPDVLSIYNIHRLDATESAKALHGRNTPLYSGNYINLFTHYRPLGDPEWYKRDNPEHTPKPLMDVGECRLTGQIDEYSQGAVTCDNDAVGPHLSPRMFTATNGDDLFQWWKSVGPKE